MGVVRAKIQTVEEIYRLLWTAVASKRPIGAVYKKRPRLFCPHRLGRIRIIPVRPTVSSMLILMHRISQGAAHRTGSEGCAQADGG
jgi:hypothetical protein